MKIILLIAALALPATAQAQVYKCQDGGRTVYSQDPCPGRAQIIDATPATGGYDPGAAAQRIRPRHVPAIHASHCRRIAARTRLDLVSLSSCARRIRQIYNGSGRKKSPLGAGCGWSS